MTPLKSLPPDAKAQASFLLSAIGAGMAAQTYACIHLRSKKDCNNLYAPIYDAMIGEDIAAVPTGIAGLVLGVGGGASWDPSDRILATLGTVFGVDGLGTGVIQVAQDYGCRTTT